MSPTDRDNAPHPEAYQKKKRPCLRCRKSFTSKGWHNRLCSKCRSGPRIDEWPEILPMTDDELVEMDKPITPEVSK